MMESIHRYFLYHYPALPGGGLTVAVLFLMLAGFIGLYKQTKWGGWIAFFFLVAFYTVPLLTEYHKH